MTGGRSDAAADHVAMDSKKMVTPLVLASDERYAMPLATTLRSIVESNSSKQPLDIYVLTDGIREHIRGKIRRSLPAGAADIRWIEVDLGLFRDFATINHISKITFARLLLPHILPNTSKVLYLDSDILVLDGLQDLCNIELGGNILGAVTDGLDSELKAGTLNATIPPVQDYFNAGVLLIDLDRWREERVSEKALQYLAANPSSPFSDQDALNVACDGQWAKLDRRWNYLVYDENLAIASLDPDARPRIAHFVTWKKPWKAACWAANSDLYDAFRGRTLFARTFTDRVLDVLRNAWARFRYSPPVDAAAPSIKMLASLVRRRLPRVRVLTARLAKGSE